jgi:hypothetical protein
MTADPIFLVAAIPSLAFFLLFDPIKSVIRRPDTRRPPL